MVDKNQPSAPAAAVAGGAGRVYVPGTIVSAGDVEADEPTFAGQADLGALISRERRRAAEARAEADADEPLVNAAGARVCCVMCFNKHAAARAEENATSVEGTA